MAVASLTPGSLRLLADLVAEANEKRDVASFREPFPARLEKLVKKKGDRLGS